MHHLSRGTANTSGGLMIRPQLHPSLVSYLSPLLLFLSWIKRKRGDREEEDLWSGRRVLSKNLGGWEEHRLTYHWTSQDKIWYVASHIRRSWAGLPTMLHQALVKQCKQQVSTEWAFPAMYSSFFFFNILRRENKDCRGSSL